MAVYYNRWSMPGQGVVHRSNNNNIVDKLVKFGYTRQDILYAITQVENKDNSNSIKEFIDTNSIVDSDKVNQPVFIWKDQNTSKVNRNIFDKQEHVHITETIDETINLIRKYKMQKRAIYIIATSDIQTEYLIKRVRYILNTEIVIFGYIAEEIRVKHYNITAIQKKDKLNEWVYEKIKYHKHSNTFGLKETMFKVSNESQLKLNKDMKSKSIKDQSGFTVIPAERKPVVSLKLDVDFNEWDHDKQEEFLQNLANELKIERHELTVIAKKRGSTWISVLVSAAVTAFDAAQEQIPITVAYIEDAVNTATESLTSALNGVIKSSEIMDWFKDEEKQKEVNLSMIYNKNSVNYASSKNVLSNITSDEQWLLQQTQSLRNALDLQLEKMDNKFEVKAICMLDNTNSFKRFVKHNNIKKSKLLFHGTKLEFLSSIYETGLQHGGGAVYGHGSYVTSSPLHSIYYMMCYKFEYKVTYNGTIKSFPNEYKLKVNGTHIFIKDIPKTVSQVIVNKIQFDDKLESHFRINGGNYSNNEFTLIAAYVNCGNSKQITDMSYNKKNIEKQYDSHFIAKVCSTDRTKYLGYPVKKFQEYKGGIADEYAIRDATRILPRYLITLKKTVNIEFEQEKLEKNIWESPMIIVSTKGDKFDFQFESPITSLQLGLMQFNGRHVVISGYRTKNDIIKQNENKKLKRKKNKHELFNKINIGYLTNFYDRNVEFKTCFVGSVNNYISKCNVYHNQTITGLEFIINNGESFSIGNCCQSLRNEYTEIRPPNDNYALIGFKGNCDSVIYNISFIFAENESIASEDKMSPELTRQITTREKKLNFQQKIKHYPLFIWRDKNVANNFNSNIFTNDKEVYSAITSQQAIELIKKFNIQKRIIYVITNGGDNAEHFIEKVRQLKIDTEIVIFCSAVQFVKKWANNWKNVTVMTGADNLRKWVDNKMLTKSEQKQSGFWEDEDEWDNDSFDEDENENKHIVKHEESKLEIEIDKKQSLDMNKYERMKTLGLPITSIVNQMIIDGVDDMTIEEFSGKPINIDMKQKQLYQPTRELKQFNWLVIDKNKVNNTIWKDDNKKILFERILNKVNFKEIETHFYSNKSEKQKISLIDQKRAFNVSVGLAQFKMSQSELLDAILSMNEKKLSVEQLRRFLPYVPTDGELQMIRHYISNGGAVNKLSQIEQFFAKMIDLVYIRKRISLWIFKLEFPSTLQHIRSKIDTIFEVIEVLQHSKRLKQILYVVLAIGNYMNTDSHRGNAFGFKLESALSLLCSVKANNTGKTSLLRFIIEQISSIDQDALKWAEESEILNVASKIKISDILKAVDEMKSKMDLIKKHLNTQRRSMTKMASNWAKSGSTVTINQIARHLRHLARGGIQEFGYASRKPVPTANQFGNVWELNFSPMSRVPYASSKRKTHNNNQTVVTNAALPSLPFSSTLAVEPYAMLKAPSKSYEDETENDDDDEENVFGKVMLLFYKKSNSKILEVQSLIKTMQNSCDELRKYFVFAEDTSFEEILNVFRVFREQFIGGLKGFRRKVRPQAVQSLDLDEVLGGSSRSTKRKVQYDRVSGKTVDFNHLYGNKSKAAAMYAHFKSQKRNPAHSKILDV